MTVDEKPNSADSGLRTPEAYANPTSECDLVMKGGITSGVVYPLAVCELAQTYRLRGIGGTSAGAIAAAVAAAAEYGRDHGGYVRLARLPAELSEMDRRRRSTRLLRLFQAEPATRPLFRVLQALVAAKPKGGRVVAVVAASTGVVLRSWWGIANAVILLLPGLLLLVVGLDRPSTALWSLAGMALAGLVLVIGRRLLEYPESARKDPVPSVSTEVPISEAGPTLADLVVAEGQAAQRGADKQRDLSVQRRRARMRLGGVGLIALVVIVAITAAKPHTGPVVVGVFGWLLIAAGLVVAVLLELVRIALHQIPSNMYGICTGQGTQDGEAALTPWLAKLLDDTAFGEDSENGPLTFGHLWAGPNTPRISGGDPRPVDYENQRQVGAAINLEMMTTALSEGRPYRMPFLPAGAFMFDPAEMRKLFNDDIVQWMMLAASTVIAQDRTVQRRIFWSSVGRLLPLPAAADLPVVVAARMSLSFPGLISAVPLYAVDWTRDRNIRWGRALALIQAEEAAKVRQKDAARGDSEHDLIQRVAERLNELQIRPHPERVWFSDGGITSNFPVTIFDKVLPQRPTFGINLSSFHPDAIRDPHDETRNIVVASNYRTSLAPLRDFETNGPSLLGFLGSIKDTMQNWADSQQMGAQGHRDQIAHVSLTKDEGGMNLDMPQERIAALTGRGRAAAAALVERFTQPVYGDRFTAWDNQRWLRLRIALATLVPTLRDMDRALISSSTYAELLALPPGVKPSYAWTHMDQEAATRLLEDIARAVAPTGLDQINRLAPRPAPRLRIVPPI